MTFGSPADVGRERAFAVSMTVVGLVVTIAGATLVVTIAGNAMIWAVALVVGGLTSAAIGLSLLRVRRQSRHAKE